MWRSQTTTPSAPLRRTSPASSASPIRPPELVGFEASIDVSSVGLYEYLDGTWQIVREFPFGG